MIDNFARQSTIGINPVRASKGLNYFWLQFRAKVVPLVMRLRPFRSPRLSFTLVLFICACFLLNSCQYVTNRVADLGDVAYAGVGVTAENTRSGIWPGALGVHLQATDFVNLGAVCFEGFSAEIDGRGLFAGPEKRFRAGLLHYQRMQVNQDYDVGYENYFKTTESLWVQRMKAFQMRWSNMPAKNLDYYMVEEEIYGKPAFHRGWQYWGTWSLELAMSEPFLTHWGVDLRLGLDISEISDFLLGLVLIDFKRDDLNREEFEEMMATRLPVREFKPASDYQEPVE